MSQEVGGGIFVRLLVSSQNPQTAGFFLSLTMKQIWHLTQLWAEHAVRASVDTVAQS